MAVPTQGSTLWVSRTRLNGVKPLNGGLFYSNAHVRWLQRRINLWEKLWMPRKYQYNKNSMDFDTYFVPCRLNSADLKAFEAWRKEQKDGVENMIERGLTGGYKLSVTFSTEKQGFCASHTCKDPGSKHAGAILTSWAGDWLTAALMNIFKMECVLLSEDDWSAANEDTWG